MLRNITLSAEALLIDNVRKKAVLEGRSLNELFRDWLKRYALRREVGEEYTCLMKRLKKVSAGKRFTRDELNER